MTWLVRGWFKPSKHVALCQARLFPPLRPATREGPSVALPETVLCPVVFAFSHFSLFLAPCQRVWALGFGGFWLQPFLVFIP